MHSSNGNATPSDRSRQGGHSSRASSKANASANEQAATLVAVAVVEAVVVPAVAHEGEAVVAEVSLKVGVFCSYCTQLC